MSTGKKICLVVDDEETVRSVTSVLAKRLGFSVIEAKDGREAFGICKKALPDVILLDRYMPEMDGIEFLKVLRALEGDDKVVVIMCSGENKVEMVKEAMDSGANNYILKPIELEDLRKRLIKSGITF